MFVANCLLFHFNKVPDVQPDFTQYSASILKVWCEIFPTFNVAKTEVTVANVS